MLKSYCPENQAEMMTSPDTAKRLQLPLASNDLAEPPNNSQVLRVKVKRKLIQRFKRDREFREKVTRTAWLCFSIFSLGVGGGMRGPALMDLQIITKTNIQQASAFFTAGAAGFITGTLTAGVVYDLVSKTLLLLVCLVAVAAFTAVTPFCSNYWLMLAVSLAGAFFGGGIDTVCNADVVTTWSGPLEGQTQATVMQALHFTFSLGALAAPLIIEPFLTSAPDPILAPTVNSTYHNISADAFYHVSSAPFVYSRAAMSAVGAHDASDELAATDSSDTSSAEHSHGTNSSSNGGGRKAASDDNDSEADTNATWHNTALVVVLVKGDTTDERRQRVSTDETHFTRVASKNVSMLGEAPFPGFAFNATGKSEDNVKTRVHYAFMICALLALIPAIPLAVDYACKKQQNKQRDGHGRRRRNEERNSKSPELSGKKNRGRQLPRAMHLLLLAWFCGFYMVYAGVEDTFSTFLTYYVVNKVGWSNSQGALMTSVYWTAFAATRFACIFLVTLLSHVQLLAASFALLLVALMGCLFAVDWGLWASCVLSGAAMAAIFPGGLSWADAELLPMSGRSISAVILASSMSNVINPMIIGYLMNNYGPVWFAYVVVGETILAALVFFSLLIFVRCFLHKWGLYTARGETDIVVSSIEQNGDLALSENLLQSTDRVNGMSLDGEVETLFVK